MENTFTFLIDVSRGDNHKNIIVTAENLESEFAARRAVINKYLADGFRVRKIDRIYIGSPPPSGAYR